jgi:hypothetical protein
MSNVNYKSDQIFLYWDEPFTNSNSNKNDSTANED